MEILVGDEHINGTPVRPYDERVCDMLDAWAQAIRGDSEAKEYPDVLTFGFFIRKGSIAKKREAFFRKNSCVGMVGAGSGSAKSAGDDSDAEKAGDSSMRRLGRGIAFHIAPSNVPVNCMYTLVFGLLSGCANIVRVPSKEFPQVEILCRTLGEVLKKHKFAKLSERIQVIRYDRDEKYPDGRSLTAFFSSICDVRVIWGGDDTVTRVRENPISPRTKEITFADRYSVGIIDVQAVIDASDDEIRRLAENFYNDTYLMDQNACSSPHLIAWTLKKHVDECMKKRVASSGLADIPGSLKAVREMTEPGMSSARDRFWKAVTDVAVERYDLADIKASEKFADLCEFSAGHEPDDGGLSNDERTSSADLVEDGIRVAGINRYADNYLYVCDVEKITGKAIETCRGKYGMFFQVPGIEFDVLKPVLDNTKVQTVAVFGIEAEDVADWVVDNGICGVDRVVPFGKTLDIDIVWDGYDIIDEMSRTVSVK